MLKLQVLQTHLYANGPENGGGYPKHTLNICIQDGTVADWLANTKLRPRTSPTHGHLNSLACSEVAVKAVVVLPTDGSVWKPA